MDKTKSNKTQFITYSVLFFTGVLVFIANQYLYIEKGTLKDINLYFFKFTLKYFEYRIIFLSTGWLSFIIATCLTLINYESKSFYNQILAITIPLVTLGILVFIPLKGFEQSALLLNIILFSFLTYQIAEKTSKKYQFEIRDYEIVFYSFFSCFCLFLGIGNTEYFSFSKKFLGDYLIINKVLEIRSIISITIIAIIFINVIFVAFKTSQESYNKWKIEWSFFIHHIPKALYKILIKFAKTTLVLIIPNAQIALLFFVLFKIKVIRYYYTFYIDSTSFIASIDSAKIVLTNVIFIILVITIFRISQLYFLNKPKDEDEDFKLEFNHLPVGIIVLIVVMGISSLSFEFINRPLKLFSISFLIIIAIGIIIGSIVLLYQKITQQKNNHQS